jgi:hypothetical protein
LNDVEPVIGPEEPIPAPDTAVPTRVNPCQ